MRSNLNIRRAASADIAQLIPLARETFSDAHARSTPPAEFKIFLDQMFALERVESELANPANIFHVVLENEKLIAYSKTIFNTATPSVSAQNVVKLERLYIDKNYRRKGIGKQLLDLNYGLASAAKQNGMWLTVWVENHSAIEFYKQNGFTIAGEIFYKVLDKEHPNHVMYWEF